MSSPKTAIVAFVAFVIGMLLGISMISGPEARDRRVQRITGSESERRRLPWRDSYESLNEVLDSLKSGAMAKGSGPIRGQVTTLDGTALSGAEVVAELSLPESPAGREPSLEDEIRHVTEMRRLRDTFNKRTLTNTDGEFVFENMPPLSFQVNAAKRGYRIKGSWYAYRARPGYRLKFNAEPTASLPIIVEMTDGGAVPEDTTIEYSYSAPNVSGQLEAKWWPGRPPLELDAGDYIMSAVSGVDKAWRSEACHLSIERGREAPEVRLVLKARPGIKGQVTVPGNFSAREFDVTCIRYDGEPPTDGRVSGKDDYEDRARDVATEESGFAFALVDLPPGKYALFVVEGRMTVARELLELKGEVVERKLTAPEPNPSDYLVITVLSPEGKPARCSSVSPGFAQGGTFSTGTTIRAPNGDYWVPRITDSDVRSTGNSSLVITAFSEIYGRMSEPYIHGETTKLTIRFGARGK